MCLATIEAARDMMDDLDHMREIIAKPFPTTGDLRRMSNLLRRLLIDNGGDLRKISPPRLGRRLHLMVPDAKPFLQEIRSAPLYFASLCAPGILNFNVTHVYFRVKNRPASESQDKVTLMGRSAPEDDRLVALRAESFLSQPVLYFSGEHINRDQVIKYVANVARGVHFGAHKEPHHHLLRHIRQLASVTMTDGSPGLRLYTGAITGGDRPIDISDQAGLDFVLLQMMATARSLTISPDIIELENIVRSELVNNR